MSVCAVECFKSDAEWKECEGRAQVCSLSTRVARQREGMAEGKVSWCCGCQNVSGG